MPDRFPFPFPYGWFAAGRVDEVPAGPVTEFRRWASQFYAEPAPVPA